MTGQMRLGAAPLFLATHLLSPQASLLLLLLLAAQQGFISGKESLGYGILEPAFGYPVGRDTQGAWVRAPGVQPDGSGQWSQAPPSLRQTS